MTADALDARLARLEGSYEQIDRRLGAIEATVGRLDAKIEGVEARLEAKIEGVEARLETKIAAVETKLDAKIDGVRGDIISAGRWQVGLTLTTWITLMLAIFLHHA
ncbi:MAG: hypothetical protein ACREM2_02200 [Vulcanimicrobiaceae bacterium]